MFLTPKMDGGENNGKAYEQMDDLGGFSLYFWKHPPYPWSATCVKSCFSQLRAPSSEDQALGFDCFFATFCGCKEPVPSLLVDT